MSDIEMDRTMEKDSTAFHIKIDRLIFALCDIAAATIIATSIALT